MFSRIAKAKNKHGRQKNKLLRHASFIAEFILSKTITYSLMKAKPIKNMKFTENTQV